MRGFSAVSTSGATNHNWKNEEMRENIGELKKRIIKDFRCEPYDWICTAPIEEYSDSERWVTVDTVNKILDEAKKEFPIDESLNDEDELEQVHKINMWFKKWFIGESIE
jgi:hypothetical protein